MSAEETRGDGSYVREYEPVRAAGMAGTMRFGHNANITSLFVGTEEDAGDYVFGLLFACSFVLAFFLIWLLLICCFRCLGPKRVGYWSGGPFREDRSLGPKKSLMEKRNQDEDDDYAGDDEPIEGERDYNVEATYVRGCFAFSSVVFITFGFFFVTLGLTGVDTTVNTLLDNSNEVNIMSTEAEFIIARGLLNVRDIANDVRRVLVTELIRDDFCPAIAVLEDTSVATEVRGFAEQAVSALNDLDDFVEDQIDGLMAAVTRVKSLTADINEQSEEYEVPAWQITLFLSLYTIIPTLFLAGTILAFFDRSYRPFTICENFVLFPIFLLMVIFMIIVSAIFLFGAGVNADFCLPGAQPNAPPVSVPNSPDPVILATLEAQGYSTNSTVGHVMQYYIFQCQELEDPFAFLYEYLPEVERASGGVETLITFLESNSRISELGLVCGRDFSALQPLLVSMREIVVLVTDSINRLFALIKCDRVVPLYTTSVYSAVCEYSMSAVAWVFASSLVMSFMGMLMICMRSSYKPTIYTDRYDKSSSKREDKDDIYSSSHHLDPDVPPETTEDYGIDESNNKKVVASANSMDDLEMHESTTSKSPEEKKKKKKKKSKRKSKGDSMGGLPKSDDPPAQVDME